MVCGTNRVFQCSEMDRLYNCVLFSIRWGRQFVQFCILSLHWGGLTQFWVVHELRRPLARKAKDITVLREWFGFIRNVILFETCLTFIFCKDIWQKSINIIICSTLRLYNYLCCRFWDFSVFILKSMMLALGAWFLCYLGQVLPSIYSVTYLVP